jgi:hypothetical protein
MSSGEAFPSPQFIDVNQPIARIPDFDQQSSMYNRWDYQVFLPSTHQTGLIEVSSLSKNKPDGYTQGYYRDIIALQTIMTTRLGHSLEHLGFSAMYDDAALSGFLTYDSSERLAERLPPNHYSVPEIRLHPENQYTKFEAMEALEQGAVLLSNSTAKRIQSVHNVLIDIKETETFIGHDVITHAAAWLSLPPPLFRRICLAARQVMDEWRMVGEDDKAKQTVETKISDKMADIDTTITIQALSSIIEHKGLNTINNYGKRLSRITDDPYYHHGSPQDLELSIYEYLCSPEALELVLSAAT